MGKFTFLCSQTIYEFLPSGIVRATKEGQAGTGSSLDEALHELANVLTLQYMLGSLDRRC